MGNDGPPGPRTNRENPVKRLASESMRGLVDIVTIDDVKRVERKYQERACLLYLVLLLALLASFCLYVQQRVSLRSNPQIATSIEPDKSFPAPNMVICFDGFKNYTWLGWGYDGMGALRPNTSFLDILEYVDDPEVAWTQGRHCFFLHSRAVLDTARLVGGGGHDDLVQTQTVAIAAAVGDVSFILDVTVALTDKTLADIKHMDSISEFQNGGSLNQASTFNGFQHLMVPAEFMRISLTRRNQLLPGSGLWSRWQRFDRYDVSNFVHYRYTRSASGLEVFSDERYNSRAGTKATIYPVLPSNISQADRDEWRRHSDDRAWVMARTIPPILKYLTQPANLTNTIIFTQLMTFHVLPVTSSEDVDPLDLNDLISNLGGAWGVLLAVFGVFFVSTEWGTREPIGPLRRRWWKDHLRLRQHGGAKEAAEEEMEGGPPASEAKEEEGQDDQQRRSNRTSRQSGASSFALSTTSFPSSSSGKRGLHRARQRSSSFAARLRHGFNSHLGFDSLEHRIKSDLPALKERVAQLEVALHEAQRQLRAERRQRLTAESSNSFASAASSDGGSEDDGHGRAQQPPLAAGGDSMVVNSALCLAEAQVHQPPGPNTSGRNHQ